VAKEYWVCVVGPIERDKLPDGSDLPMRWAVQSAFENVTGEWPGVCSSGWGCDEAEAEAISLARHEAFMRRQKNRG